VKGAGVGLVAAVVGLAVLVPSTPPTFASPPEKHVQVAEEQPELAALEVDIPRPAQGRAALRLLGEQVDAAAAVNGVETAELREILRTDESAWLSTNGLLHYKEPLVTDPQPPVAAAASYPLEETFELHSKPGAQRTIFIDVDGATVSGTEWHTQYPTTPTAHPAWDPADDGPTFSASELATVQAIWAGVAEDYAPFDVDVTTEDPGAAAIRRSGALDQEYGAHALITPSTAWDSICDEKCGGVAFINVFDKDYGPGGNGYGATQPAWIFPQGTGGDAKGIVEALSHEVGHQLGLQHDGNPSTQTEHDNGYDEGHGAWAPIMGAGYYRPITQWSKGDYAGANNQQDDIAIIRGVLGERPDEAPSTVAGAPTVPTGPAYISSRTDVDTFRLGTCTGPVTISAAPTLEAGANLDLELRLLNAVGTTVGTIGNPSSAMVDAERASGLGATVTGNLASGVYHVAVDGVGNGPWSTGYDDYGSLGAYGIEVTGACADSGTPGVPGGLSATGTTTSSVSLSWTAPTDPGSSAVTGYVLTRTGSDQVVELGAGATSYTWTGLAGGTSYTFRVAAVNAAGTGVAASTGAATGAVVPTAPRDVTATWDPLEKVILATWTPPASDGGAALTGYRIYINDVSSGTLPAAWVGAVISDVAPGTYKIGLAAVNGVGPGPVAESTVVVPVPPANDAFANRSALAGATGSVGGDNAGATAQTGDPVPPGAGLGAGGASVWYSWTAPASGPVTVATDSTVDQRDTTLAAYTGTTLGTLTLVAENDDVSEDDYLSRITFTAAAGTTYHLVVDGFRNRDAGTGPFTLTWAGTAPPVLQATTTELDVTVAGTSVTLTATVAAGALVPSGSVRFTDGAAALGAATVSGGRATLRLTGVAPGAHAYRATFLPATGSGQAGSSSPDRVVAVAAPVVASRTTIKAPRTAKAGSRPTVTVRVLRGSTPASGKVVLKYGAKKKTLTLRAGTARLKLPKVKAGKVRLTATYAGNATTRASSAKATIKVAKKRR